MPGAANGTPHVVVAAQMRSGTHLLIDLILNNFPVYRESPLYLDLERYRLSDLETSRIPDLRGLVIKTHCVPTPPTGWRRPGTSSL